MHLPLRLEKKARKNILSYLAIIEEKEGYKGYF